MSAARNTRTTEQVLAQQAKDAEAKQPAHSEKSGTQVLAQGTPQSVAPSFSDKDAIRYFVTMAGAANKQSMMTVLAGAVALYAGVYLQADGIGKPADIKDAIAKVIAEKGVKKSWAYDLLATSIKVGAWLKKTHDLGGPAQDIATAKTPADATAALAAWFYAKGATSIDSLKILTEIRAEYTTEDAARDAANATDAGKKKAAAKRLRQANANALERVADIATRSLPAVIGRLEKAGQTPFNLAKAIAETIKTPDECAQVLDLFAKRHAVLVSQTPQGVMQEGNEAPALQPNKVN